MCVNESDLLLTSKPWHNAPQTCLQFSDDFEVYSLNWSAASVCDDLKTLDRGTGAGPGELWEWLLNGGTSCCGSWDKAKCLSNVTLDTCDGAYIKVKELTSDICRKDDTDATDHKYTEASCGTEACKAVISSLDDAALATMKAGLQVRGARLSLARSRALSLALSRSLSISTM